MTWAALAEVSPASAQISAVSSAGNDASTHGEAAETVPYKLSRVGRLVSLFLDAVKSHTCVFSAKSWAK